MFNGIEVWQLAAGLVVAVAGGCLAFLGAMARFLKRPSPSEAIIRIGRATTDVYIGRATWIVPMLHRAATLSLSTIGLTIRRASHEALVTKDFISTNLSAEFYIRVEPAEDDVKKAARTIGIDEGHASSESIRKTAQELLEPKLVGALRAVAAQSDFLALHMNREHFAQEVSKALREDLGRNGFTLESVTITELTQTPLSDMRADDIFGASGRQTGDQHRGGEEHRGQAQGAGGGRAHRRDHPRAADQRRHAGPHHARGQGARGGGGGQGRAGPEGGHRGARSAKAGVHRGGEGQEREDRTVRRDRSAEGGGSGPGGQAEDHRGGPGRQGDHAHPQGEGERRGGREEGGGAGAQDASRTRSAHRGAGGGGGAREAGGGGRGAEGRRAGAYRGRDR